MGKHTQIKWLASFKSVASLELELASSGLWLAHVPVIKMLFHSRIIYSFFQIVNKDIKQNQTSHWPYSQHIALSH